MNKSRKHWNGRRQGYETDSKWEQELKDGIFKDLKYHPCKIPYTIEHTYQPDWVIDVLSLDDCFIHTNGFPIGLKKVYIEAKGLFRDASELQKYVAVKNHFTMGQELVFLFMKPNAPIYFKTKRKDGTKMTHAEFAEKHGFRWFTVETIGQLLNEIK